MKAAVLYGKKDLRVEEVDLPILDKDEVMIKVKATGICGSDIPRVLVGSAHFFPIILGHEFSGVVVAVGEDVKETIIGDRVTAVPLKPCYICEDCLKGNYSLCKNYSVIGSREFGSWAEYVKVPKMNVVKIPDNVEFIEAAFIEPITIAIHGLYRMDFKPLSTVAITGMGTIGLLTLQCAQLMGAKEITVFDIDDRQLEVAKKLGATHVINTLSEDMMTKVDTITNGRGFEMVLETAGVPATEMLCLELAANHGKVMYIGTPHVSFEVQPRQFELINRKELIIQGSWMSYSLPFPGKAWTMAAYYLGKEKIKVRELIDRVIPIEKITEAFQDIESRKVSGKIIMELEKGVVI